MCPGLPRSLCRWQQKRLPSSAEWELVALASETAPDGRKDPGYQARLLEWYTLLPLQCPH